MYCCDMDFFRRGNLAAGFQPLASSLGTHRRRKIFCVDYRDPLCITGMQGVCDTLNLCRIVSAYRIIDRVHPHLNFGLGFSSRRDDEITC